MNSNDEIPVRKALSAEKSQKIYASFDLSDTTNRIETRTFKSCVSASLLSTRRKPIQEGHIKNLITDESSPKYLTLTGKEDQKLFLSASQTLEKLNKVISRHSEIPPGEGNGRNFDILSFENKKFSLRQLILYHDVLKKLLEERCNLLLKEECDVCVKRTVKLVDDFKRLYISEKLKIITLPTQTFNRFVCGTDINLSSLEVLIKKLKIISDLHSSVNSSYQKIINQFQVGLDLELFQLVLKTNKILAKHRSNLFYWAHKYVIVFMQKLCLADPGSVSPDFLQSVLNNYHIFDSLLKENKGVKDPYIKLGDLFYSHVKKHEYKEFSFNLVLNQLSFFEAIVASERIVHQLTSICKKSRQLKERRKQALHNDTVQNGDGNTSDYCSASFSDVDNSSVKLHPIMNANSNFVNPFVSIMQRNQSQILKFLYAITNLGNVNLNKFKRRASSGNDRFPVRQMWNLPEHSSMDDSYSYLEQMYWSNFWTNVRKFVLKILFEIPYHQYGDSAAGTVVLWPDSFLDTLSECLKWCSESNDASTEGKCVAKQIYTYIFVHRIQQSWDKKFSLALTASHSHLCPPVPTELNLVRTHPGNLFFACLQSALDVYEQDLQDMGSLLHLQCLNQLQSVLVSFVLWANNKTRAALSSRNFPTYLLISYADCKSANQLLKDEAVAAISSESCVNTYRRVRTTKYQAEQMLLKQIDILAGLEIEAPSILYKLCFASLKDAIVLSTKNKNSWKKCSMFPPFNITVDFQEEVIFPLAEVINHLSGVFPVLVAMVSSIADVLLHLLPNKQFLNPKNVRLARTEISKCLQWIDKLDLTQSEKNTIVELHSIRKLDCVLKLIEGFSSQPVTCLKQRNRIVPSSTTETRPDESLLSDEERCQWQTLIAKTASFSCF